jgi:hypothetical protein
VGGLAWQLKQGGDPGTSDHCCCHLCVLQQVCGDQLHSCYCNQKLVMNQLSTLDYPCAGLRMQRSFTSTRGPWLPSILASHTHMHRQVVTGHLSIDPAIEYLCAHQLPGALPLVCWDAFELCELQRNSAATCAQVARANLCEVMEELGDRPAAKWVALGGCALCPCCSARCWDTGRPLCLVLASAAMLCSDPLIADAECTASLQGQAVLAFLTGEDLS